jgi:hypothetical protein
LLDSFPKAGVFRPRRIFWNFWEGGERANFLLEAFLVPIFHADPVAVATKMPALQFARPAFGGE